MGLLIGLFRISRHNVWLSSLHYKRSVSFIYLNVCNNGVGEEGFKKKNLIEREFIREGRLFELEVG